MRLVCSACGLTLRDGEPHEDDFCEGIALARRVAEAGEFTGQEFVIDRNLFERFRDAWTGLTNATRQELVGDLRLGAGESARQRVAARHQHLKPLDYSILHACGHEEEHRLEGAPAARAQDQERLAAGPCFFCSTRETHNEALAAAALRRLPTLVSDDRRQRWWGEICREEVLQACDRHIADLHAEYEAVEARLNGVKSVRGPDCTGCETREDYDAVFAAWDADLTGEEVERKDAEDTEHLLSVQPYVYRVCDAEEALHALEEVTEPEFWIARRGWTGKQVLECAQAASIPDGQTT